jgi:hypothetical protein
MAGVEHDVRFEVDLDQTGGGDLAEELSVGVDQEVVLGAGNADGGGIGVYRFESAGMTPP